LIDGTGSLWTHWGGHAEALVGLIVLELAYLIGVGPLRERHNLADEVETRQVATFTTGVLVIFVAVLSPIHAVAESYLFSVHMIQHVLITLVAPPLLIWGTPDWLIRPLLRPNWAFRLARYLTHPVAAFAAFNLIFSFWHVPGLYNLSLTNHGVHFGEHLLMIGTAVMMWWPLTSTMPELPRLSYPAQMAYLFGLSIAQLIVFGTLTFAREPIYEFYVNAPRVWSVSPLADQQIGAIIMKLGGGILFIVLLIVAFYRWYGDEERRTATEAAERRGTYDRFYDDSSPELEDTLT
jgi:putative membrane protein